MIVNVAFVGMGADKELILALCPAHRRFIADPVGLLRGDFPLGKGLAELVAQLPQLLRVQAVVKTVFQALNGRPLDGLFVEFDVCRGR